MELAGGRAERIVLSYRGRLAEHDTRLLTVAALNGVFEGRTEQPVNAVNAALVAAERGIAVEEQSERLSPDYTSLVQVAVAVERGRDGRGGDDDRRRGPALARRRARLQDRDRARAATWCSSSTTTGRA